MQLLYSAAALLLLAGKWAVLDKCGHAETADSGLCLWDILLDMLEEPVSSSGRRSWPSRKTCQLFLASVHSLLRR